VRLAGVRFVLVALAATALTAVAYLPIVEHPNSTVVGSPNDLSSSARDAWAAARQHQTLFTMTRDRLFDVPQGHVRSPAVQIANAVQPLFIEGTHRFAGYLGAMNLLMLAGVAATLVATYMLLERLGMHPLAAAAGAAAFASSQFTVEQLLYGHSAFAQMWVFPALLGSLLWARRGRLIRSAVPGLVYALSFYVNSYLGLLASLVVAVFLLALVWQRRSLRLDLGRLGIGVGTAIAGLLPAALATRIAPSSRIGLTDTALYGAKLRDFFLPSTRHVLYGRAVGAVFPQHRGDSVAFFGFCVLALAVAALVMLRRRTLAWSLPLRFAVLAVPIGWFASLPAHAHVWGLNATLPDASEVIGTFVQWWRIYNRLAAVAGFGLVLLAVATLDRLLRSGDRRARAVAAVAIPLMLLEALPGLPVPTYRFHVDPSTAWLRAHPGGAVAIYPMPQPVAVNQARLDDLTWGSYYLQVVQQHPLFQSKPDQTSLTIPNLVQSLTSDPSRPVAASLLRRYGVRWVVIHRDVYSAIGQSPPTLGRGFAPVASFPGVQVLRVTAPPADFATVAHDQEPAVAKKAVGGDAPLSFGAGFQLPERYQNYRDGRWLEQDGVVAVPSDVALPLVVYELRLAAFSAQGTRRVDVYEGTRRVASFPVPADALDVVRRFRFCSGNSLRFVATPGPEPLGPSDPRLASVFFENLVLAPVDVDSRPC
jgi:hypothetical protein